MDRNLILEHLKLAREHVATGERHIPNQREIIAHLEHDGHDTSDAKDLLTKLEEVQKMHVSDRDRLERNSLRTPKNRKPEHSEFKISGRAGASVSYQRPHGGEFVPSTCVHIGCAEMPGVRQQDVRLAKLLRQRLQLLYSRHIPTFRN
jgi:hypothetical protein